MSAAALRREFSFIAIRADCWVTGPETELDTAATSTSGINDVDRMISNETLQLIRMAYGDKI